MHCVEDDPGAPHARVNCQTQKGIKSDKSGANDEIRTRDLRFTKPLLYQLSYIGVTGKDRGLISHDSPTPKI
jgi:hypothetical protein